MSKAPLIIAGLGNPGAEYRATYHNVGADFVETLAGSLLDDGIGSPEWKFKRGFRYANLKTRGDQGIVLVIPESFMNVSGPAIEAALHFFRVKPEGLILVHDDSDIAIGEVRLQTGRGAAGHHGVESVIKALGTKEFHRGRIGIRPGRATATWKAGGHVLRPVSRKDREILADAFQKLARKLMEKV